LIVPHIFPFPHLILDFSAIVKTELLI